MVIIDKNGSLKDSSKEQLVSDCYIDIVIDRSKNNASELIEGGYILNRDLYINSFSSFKSYPLKFKNLNEALDCICDYTMVQDVVINRIYIGNIYSPVEYDTYTDSVSKEDIDNFFQNLSYVMDMSKNSFAYHSVAILDKLKNVEPFLKKHGIEYIS